MSLSAALSLTKMGFEVFPLGYDSKIPAIDDFPNRASIDPEKLKLFWIDPVMEHEQPFNVGISTTKFKDGALLVVDIDSKNGKDGESDLLRLELEGFSFPTTLEQKTPTGRHLIYSVEKPLKPSVGELAPGIDTRSRGGFIVGAGSVFEGRSYSINDVAITRAPQWVIDRFKEDGRNRIQNAVLPVVSPQSVDRATEYLVKLAPLAVEGSSGDQTTFAVAARVKDFGLDVDTCFELMTERWNSRCSPPWEHSELRKKIENAYSYGHNAPGSDSPEANFSPIEETKEDEKLHPFDELNKKYAYILIGGKDSILHETSDSRGRFKASFVQIDAFHRDLASKTIQVGEGVQQLTRAWLRSPRRRSFEGVCFSPEQPFQGNYYNLWRGFSVKPLDRTPTPREQDSLDAFLSHAKENVCVGSEELYQWLITYFAHMVQRPWEKPNVAIAMRGGKGVGKNALIERVGFLFGNSFAGVSKKDEVFGTFNEVLENKVFLVLNEVFWSGDKDADSTLKELITGEEHRIRRMHTGAYPVKNCLRLAILGNEDWIVPASEDERRYAVFDVGDGRKQDRHFFREMREGMEAGGYRLLLRYLMDFDISKADVTLAPETEGLVEQKRLSLNPFYQWWEYCLADGKISGLEAEWPWEVHTKTFRDAFYEHLDERKIGGRKPLDASIGKMLKACLPNSGTRKRRTGNGFQRDYQLGSLKDAREAWVKYIDHPMKWETTEEEELMS